MLVHTDRALHYLCSLPPVASIAVVAAAARATAARRRLQATARRYYKVYYVATATLLRGHHEATTRLRRGLPRGYYYKATKKSTTRPLRGLLRRGHYEATTRLLRGYHQATTVRGYEQEPRARHLASSTAAAAQLVCRRRSTQQLGAGADDPHTVRRISRRPFSTCRTSRPTPESTHATRP